QAEDGIRDRTVTGVQTCALPISTVVPVGKKFELAPPQASLCERGASDGDAHARRLPGDPAFFCDRFARGDHAARDESWPAFVLEIGRASCRERVESAECAGAVEA